jgi:hypothetical protein
LVDVESGIRVEMSMTASALPPMARPIASLITLAQNKPPEIASFPCVQPVETAADKLSALAWRLHARRRGNDEDDPTIIRHLHDLAALKDSVATITAGPVRLSPAQNPTSFSVGCSKGLSPMPSGHTNIRIMCGKCLTPRSANLLALTKP